MAGAVRFAILLLTPFTVDSWNAAFAASVFINSHFINTTSSLSDEQTNTLFTFPAGSVKIGQDNVITVVQDHMGNDEDPTGESDSVDPARMLTLTYDLI